jgi:hypothetical protein
MKRGAEDHDRYNHDCRQDAADRFIIPSRDSTSSGGGLSRVGFPASDRKTSTDTLTVVAHVGFGGCDAAPMFFDSNHTGAVQGNPKSSVIWLGQTNQARRVKRRKSQASRATATGIVVTPVSPAGSLAGSVAKPASGQVSRRTSAPCWSGKPSQPQSSP